MRWLDARRNGGRWSWPSQAARHWLAVRDSSQMRLDGGSKAAVDREADLDVGGLDFVAAWSVHVDRGRSGPTDAAVSPRCRLQCWSGSNLVWFRVGRNPDAGA